MLFVNNLLIFIALLFISLSIKKHKKQIFKDKDISYLKFIIASGWILLVVVGLLFIDQYSLGVGLAYWFGIVSINSFILAFFYGRYK